MVNNNSSIQKKPSAVWKRIIAVAVYRGFPLANSPTFFQALGDWIYVDCGIY